MTTIKELQKIFSTEERIKMLSEILTSDIASVSSLSRKTGVNKGLASTYTRFLLSIGVVSKESGFFSPNINNPVTKILKVLLNISKIDGISAPEDLGVGGMGIYGSVARGTDTEESDVDMWIKTKKKPDEEKVAKFTAKIRNTMGMVKMLVLTPEKIKLLKKEDPIFYHSLVFGSIILEGDGLEE